MYRNRYADLLTQPDHGTALARELRWTACRDVPVHRGDGLPRQLIDTGHDLVHFVRRQPYAVADCNSPGFSHGLDEQSPGVLPMAFNEIVVMA